MLSTKVFLKTPEITLCGTPGYMPEPDKLTAADWDIAGLLTAYRTQETAAGDVDNRSYFKEISAQWYLPSCTGNSGADLLEALIIWDLVHKHGMSVEEARKATPHLSRMAPWWYARNMMDPPQIKNPKSGAWNRLICEVALRHGLPTEELWPYDPKLATTRPSLSAAHDGRPRARSRFYAVKCAGAARINDIRRTLKTTPGLLAGINLGPDFGTYKGGVLKKPNSLSNAWHSVVLCGYSVEKRAILARNSWGTDWGEDGYFWMSEGYIGSSTFTHGLYAIY